jgi:heme exporter protein A
MIASVTAEKLACARGDRRIFADLDFRLVAGEALVVEGANGAGKTSLLRLVAGFLAPAGGRLVFEDENGLISEGEERGRHIGWLGHLDGIKPQMNTGEQLEFFARLYGVSDDVRPLLERVGIARQRSLPCRYLSAGQKKRLGLARLLLSRRPVWLLDEPFAALDAAGRALAADLMRAHCGAGGIVMAATHDPLGIAGRSLRLEAA